MLQAYSPNQSDALIYTQHLEGGYALIKARSQRFPDDATTKRMTQLLRPQSVRGFSFVETRLVPEELVQILRSSRSTTDADDKRPLQAALVGELETIWKQVAHASATVAPLQAQANRLLSLELEDLAAIQEILDVLDRAEGAEKLIKQDLSLMDLRLVQRELYYAPTDPFDPDSAEAWSGPILEHKSTAISGVLNKWRACRLVLICITMRCKYWLHGVGYRDYMPYDRDYDYNEVQQQVDEICANVPFMMGLDLDALVSFQPSTKTRTRHHGGGALMIMWSMFVCINIASVPELQKSWLRSRLLFIADHFGFGNARIMAGWQLPFLSDSTGCWQDFAQEFGWREDRFGGRLEKFDPTTDHDIYERPML